MYLGCIWRFNALSDKRCRISKSLYTPSLLMLFLLFLYYLLLGVFIDAGPIPTAENRSLAENHCTDLTHCWTIWEIVWSCLVTIFSRTWVAVHPNVPCPKKRETGFKDVYVTHYCRLPNTIFRCSSVHCLYLSTFSLGQSDSTWKLGK